MPKILEGKIVSIKTPKTILVYVERSIKHPKYQKVIKRSKKYKVHNENIEVAIGDLVKIQETKPISKDKYFIIIKNLKKSIKK